eukprot:scaffold10899_cov70-Phaeocystis_antarctica.AAC.4
MDTFAPQPAALRPCFSRLSAPPMARLQAQDLVSELLKIQIDLFRGIFIAGICSFGAERAHRDLAPVHPTVDWVVHTQ